MKKNLILFMMPFLMASCTNSVKKQWTAEYKQNVKDSLVEALGMKRITDHSEQEKLEWNNCMADKLEKVYPGGVPKRIPQDTIFSVMTNCAPWIKK